MELKAPSAYKKVYLEALTADGTDLKRIKKLLETEKNKPVYSFNCLEQELAPDYDKEKQELQELLLDMSCLDESARETKDYIIGMLEKLDGTVETITGIAESVDEFLNPMEDETDAE